LDDLGKNLDESFYLEAFFSAIMVRGVPVEPEVSTFVHRFVSIPFAIRELKFFWTSNFVRIGILRRSSTDFVSSGLIFAASNPR
ncbi:MAG: hypothetical protein ACE5OW_02690, partial [Candidatus Bathyarchaeia archaeon]